MQQHIAFCPVSPDDFEALAQLRISAMQESLERLGRFNPDRAWERLKNSFYPEYTHFIVVNGEKVGFYTFRPEADGFKLDHLYIHPQWQSLGIGSRVLALLTNEADKRQIPIRLGALKGSASNRFYQRHGFKPTSEDEWDTYYERPPKP